MRFLLFIPISISLFFWISAHKKTIRQDFIEVEIEIIYEDTISIRAIALDEDLLMYAGSHGKYGYFRKSKNQKFVPVKNATIDYNGTKPHFRAIDSNASNFFILSIESPALLYKINKKTGAIKLQYVEEGAHIFYDSISFWNDNEGVAMGDPIDGCLSIIVTRDGGETWKKVSCEKLPPMVDGEAAFAASNGNIAIVGDQTWIISGGFKSRVFYSPDKGKNWMVYETPIIQGSTTTGGYSVDFYDDRNGVIFGGDYTNPENNDKNKAITKDGGKTWNLVANGVGAGYKSCIRYIPNSEAKGMVGVGFTGISVSNDSGVTWNTISNESFYTIRFMNDSTAIAAGKNRIAKVTFKTSKK